MAGMGYFRDRIALLDKGSQEFLTVLVAIGGYCTVSQAEALKIVKSTRARARLRALERLGFLRRVAAYPVVYQVTKSTTRLLQRDSSNRRRHRLATVQARLLGVDFYLEACGWPAEFVLDHERKIATFTDAGCPLNALPQRGGKPYLSEQFVLWLPDGRIGVAMVDQPHPRAFSQLRQFVREFQPALRQIRGELELLIVLGNHHRQRLYRPLLAHPLIRKLGLEKLENAIKPYLVRRPTQSVVTLLWPASCPHEEIHDLTHPQVASRELWIPDDALGYHVTRELTTLKVEDCEFCEDGAAQESARRRA